MNWSISRCFALGFSGCFKRGTALTAAFCLATAGVSYSAPVAANHIDACTQTDDLSDTIAGCTALIASAWGTADQKAMVLNNRALAYAATGRGDEALTDFAAAIARDPGYTNAYYNRGSFLAARKQFTAALLDFDRLLALDDTSYKGFHMRGFVYEKMGECARAIADFTNAIRIGPALPQTFNNRGVCYRKTGAHQPAMDDFDAALALEPNDIKARINRAKTLTDLGRAGQAIAEFDAIIAIDPDYPECYVGRGDALARLSQSARARQDYEHALKLDPFQPRHRPTPESPPIQLGEIGAECWPDSLLDHSCIVPSDARSIDRIAAAHQPPRGDPSKTEAVASLDRLSRNH